MKAITKMTASMDMESILGMMESSMRAGGRMASSTEKEFTERMAATEKESGKTARESSGSPMTTDKVSLINEILTDLYLNILCRVFSKKFVQ